MTTKKELKTFEIKGWVQVEVTATFQALSLRKAKRQFAIQENKYGHGNGTIWNYEEGNWCSEVTFDQPIEEVKGET